MPNISHQSGPKRNPLSFRITTLPLNPTPNSLTFIDTTIGQPGGLPVSIEVNKPSKSVSLPLMIIPFVLPRKSTPSLTASNTAKEQLQVLVLAAVVPGEFLVTLKLAVAGVYGAEPRPVVELGGDHIIDVRVRVGHRVGV